MDDVILRHEEIRGIHHLVMDHGPNALDRPMMEALHSALRNLTADGAPAVILASAHPTLFCPGWDLKILAEAGREEVSEFLDTFNALILELFSYPGPTAAAISGHSVAAGCLLAIACDLRVMAAGQPRQGLSELNLGVPVPGDCLRMLRARLSSPALDELVFRGEGCTAERARELGIVHRMELEIAKLASRPRRAFVECKKMLLSDVWEDMRAKRPEEVAAFLDCWYEEETKERIAGVASGLNR